MLKLSKESINCSENQNSIMFVNYFDTPVHC